MSEREAESDEDCEVYCKLYSGPSGESMSLLMDSSAVLKPVNEYNIVDRIKEANKELFAPDDGLAEGNGKVTKVKFALNLEDYEPTDQQKDLSPSPPDELLQQLSQLKLKPIAEEPPAPSVPEESAVPPLEVPEVEEDEICEEILDLTEVIQESVPQEDIPVDDEDDFSGVDEADLDDSPRRRTLPFLQPFRSSRAPSTRMNRTRRASPTCSPNPTAKRKSAP